MNSIPQNQNRKDNLEHFAASRDLYARAKRVADLQAWIAIGFPLAAALVTAWFNNPETKVWSTFLGISATMLGTAVLDPMERRRQEEGANEQEMFDCGVFELEWPGGLAGPQPLYEMTNKASRRFLQEDPHLVRFHDWYLPAVAQLPIHLARLVCQRGNAWWDSEERSQYATVLRWLSIAVIVIVVVIGFAQKTQLRDLVATVYAPLSPLVAWGLKEHQRHTSASHLSARTRSEAEKTWRDLLSGRMSPDQAERRSRDIQDAIFYKRSSAPFIPNWLRRRQQKKYHELMAAGIKNLLEEAESAGVISRRP